MLEVQSNVRTIRRSNIVSLCQRRNYKLSFGPQNIIANQSEDYCTYEVARLKWRRHASLSNQRLQNIICPEFSHPLHACRASVSSLASY